MPTPEEARAQAEAQVRAYCGWHVAPTQDDTLLLDGPGSGVLVLPSLRVVDVTAITECGELLDPATDYAWSAAGFVRRLPGSWRVWNQYRWTRDLRAIEVQLNHGYDEWPGEVEALLDRLTARTLDGASVLSQVGAVSYATGEDGLPLTGTLSSSDKSLLDRYALPPRP